MRGRKNKEKGILRGLKRSKRKKFGEVFLHRWLVVMLVVALLYMEGLMAFVTSQKQMIEREFASARSQMSWYMHSLSPDYTEQECLNFIEYQMAMLPQSSGTFIYMCDEENMEILAGCEEKLFLMLYNDTENRIRMQSFDLKDIEGWDSYRQKLVEYQRPFRRIYELAGYTVDAFSHKTLPRSLIMKVMATDLVDYYLDKDSESKELFSMQIETTLDVPDGYIEENKEYDLNTGNVHVVGYSPTNPYMLYNKSSEDGYTLLKDFYEGVRSNSKEWMKSGNEQWMLISDNLVWQEKESFFRIQMIDEVMQRLPSGRYVIMLYATSFDVWKNYGGVLLGIGVSVFVLGTLLAFLLAKLSYNRLKAAYDLEDYRKSLTNTMAHDLKSPLMSISGYAENLRDNLNTEKQTYYSEAILNSVQYMNGIIESVLYLSKMEEGKLSLKKESLHTREVFEKLVAERRESIQERELKVEMAGDVVLEADATLLEQLLCNLLDNAVKYASKNTTICVMMKDKEISIQNVCEEDLQGVADTLCQPFVVGDTSRSNRKGSGLGLAIARNICELHGFGFELICKEKSFEAKIKG